MQSETVMSLLVKTCVCFFLLVSGRTSIVSGLPSRKFDTRKFELFFGLVTQDMNMMRDSIPELLALPELKYPIGSEPKLKVTINQYSTAAYIKTGPPIIKPEEFDRI